MEAYLDNSATTKCAREVVETVVKAMQDDYGNPSSKHMKGVDAEQYIIQAAATIARSLKCHRNSYGKQAPRESRYRIKRGTFFRQRAV